MSAPADQADKQWACPACTFLNHPQVPVCELCDKPRGSALAPTVRKPPQESPSVYHKPTSSSATSSGSVHLGVGYHRHQGGLEAMITEECGHCNDFLIQGVKNLVRKRMHMGSLQLPDDWLLKVHDSVLRECIQSAKRAVDMYKLILELADREDEHLRAQICSACGRTGADVSLIESTTCNHLTCRLCLRKYCLGLIASKKCADMQCHVASCHAELPVALLQLCTSAKEFEQYLSLSMQAVLDKDRSLVQCPNPKCDEVMELIPPHQVSIPSTITVQNDQGKPLSWEAWVHFNQYRVRCRTCNSNFCASCLARPYHSGFTCQQLKEYDAARHCRFCTTQLKANNTVKRPLSNTLADVCTEAECVERSKACCRHRLQCGHPCNGILNEQSHPPCLNENCVDEAKSPQKGDDLCQICWVEDLTSAPVVKLACGHIFHKHCVHGKVASGAPGVRLTFGYLNCPLCATPMQHQSLQKTLKPILDLKSLIERKARQRLKMEKMEDDDKVVKPGSKFFNDPLGYALASFAYYNCYKCKKPYFGGRRDCEQNAEAESRPADEFVCYDCCELAPVACKESSHKEYHVWKCRFCCSVAVWFCWGTTHFCDYCHSHEPWARAKWPRSKFTQCNGKQNCKLKIDHPPNGSEKECEFNLGCGACMNKKRQEMDDEKRKDELEDENSSQPKAKQKNSLLAMLGFE